MTRLPSEGETFGRYQPRRVLGAGGMGMVYATHDPVLEREVASKLVVPHLAPSPATSPRHQCWNGTWVVRYASCTWPRGGTGARYLFRAVNSCHGNYNVKGTSADAEAWLCPRRHADGSTSYVTLVRWTSEAAARGHHDRDWMNHTPNPGTWGMRETFLGFAL